MLETIRGWIGRIYEPDRPKRNGKLLLAVAAVFELVSAVVVLCGLYADPQYLKSQMTAILLTAGIGYAIGYIYMAGRKHKEENMSLMRASCLLLALSEGENIVFQTLNIINNNADGIPWLVRAFGIAVSVAGADYFMYMSTQFDKNLTNADARRSSKFKALALMGATAVLMTGKLICESVYGSTGESTNDSILATVIYVLFSIIMTMLITYHPIYLALMSGWGEDREKIKITKPSKDEIRRDKANRKERKRALLTMYDRRMNKSWSSKPKAASKRPHRKHG